MFSYSVDDNLKPKVDYITKELGLNITVFERFPQLFCLSVEDNLKPKVDYITKELGLDIKVFERLPQLFGYSLKNRIIPRVEYLKQEGLSLNLAIKHISLSDVVFCKKIEKSPTDYQKFKDEF